MNALKKLWLAIEYLAASLNSLAATVDTANQKLRQPIGIPADTGPVLLASDNGELEPTPLPSSRKRSKTKPIATDKVGIADTITGAEQRLLLPTKARQSWCDPRKMWLRH
jgi:hypothetical protein